jgi:uncharacterized membrane protein YeaQ/YmgE (transglycosylase-associated protein family)
MGGHTSDVLVYLLGLLISGLIIGALGRLAVPGPNPMGCLGTALVGIGGSLVGGIVGRLLFGENYTPGLIMSVLCAALIVWLVERARA